MRYTMEGLKTEYGKLLNLNHCGNVAEVELSKKYDELLTLINKYGSDNLSQAIKEHSDWDTIYNFSEERTNILGWLPISSEKKVLEIGAECGGLTSWLCAHSKSVDAIEASLEKSIVNAARNKAAENLTIYAGDCLKVLADLSGKYDYIILAGDFTSALGELKLRELLDKLKQDLTNDGKIVIAVGNRLGLKYFSGVKDDECDSYFAGITGKNNALYSKEALIREISDFPETSFYYPYPNHYFMHTLYSEERLPNKGELTDNNKNLKNDRMLLFDEKSAYDVLIEDGTFDRFSNSFLVVIGNKLPVKYAKFSTERSSATALITTLEKYEGNTVIKKHALFNDGATHISRMSENYRALCKKYEGCPVKINRCLEITKSSASFEFVEGITLTEALDACLFKGDQAGFKALLKKYLDFVYYNAETAPFNRDVIFDNILIKGEEWTLIDYEWCDENRLEPSDVAFRALHTYLVTNSKRNKFNYDLIYNAIGVTPEQGEEINLREKSFQDEVKGNRLSLADLSLKLGKKIYEPVKAGSDGIFKFQIYRADAKGSFSENNSYFYENAYETDNSAKVRLQISKEEKLIRLDPLMNSCLVKLCSVCFNGTELNISSHGQIISNGRFIKPSTFAFETADPNIIVNLAEVNTAGGTLEVSMEVYPLPSDIILQIINRLRRF